MSPADHTMTWDRLDVVLVERGMATTRSHAARLVVDGCVTIDEVVADKPARKVPPGASVGVVDGELVGRGGRKLRGALTAFGLDPDGARCLDLGASTGGFTQQLLLRGAHRVVAVDVGHNQLDQRLIDDPRVDNREGINARYLVRGDLGEPFDLVVVDLSFISLTMITQSIVDLVHPEGDVVALVKPQFEVGPDHIGRTGLVVDPRLHAQAIADVGAAFAVHGWEVRETVESVVIGADGNQEYFIWVRKRP